MSEVSHIQTSIAKKFPFIYYTITPPDHDPATCIVFSQIKKKVSFEYFHQYAFDMTIVLLKLEVFQQNKAVILESNQFDFTKISNLFYIAEEHKEALCFIYLLQIKVIEFSRRFNFDINLTVLFIFYKLVIFGLNENWKDNMEPIITDFIEAYNTVSKSEQSDFGILNKMSLILIVATHIFEKLDMWKYFDFYAKIFELVIDLKPHNKYFQEFFNDETIYLQRHSLFCEYFMKCKSDNSRWKDAGISTTLPFPFVARVINVFMSYLDHYRTTTADFSVHLRSLDLVEVKDLDSVIGLLNMFPYVYVPKSKGEFPENQSLSLILLNKHFTKIAIAVTTVDMSTLCDFLILYTENAKYHNCISLRTEGHVLEINGSQKRMMISFDIKSLYNIGGVMLMIEKILEKRGKSLELLIHFEENQASEDNLKVFTKLLYELTVSKLIKIKFDISSPDGFEKLENLISCIIDVSNRPNIKIEILSFKEKPISLYFSSNLHNCLIHYPQKYELTNTIKDMVFYLVSVCHNIIDCKRLIFDFNLGNEFEINDDLKNMIQEIILRKEEFYLTFDNSLVNYQFLQNIALLSTQKLVDISILNYPNNQLDKLIKTVLNNKLLVFSLSLILDKETTFVKIPYENIFSKLLNDKQLKGVDLTLLCEEKNSSNLSTIFRDYFSSKYQKDKFFRLNLVLGKDIEYSKSNFYFVEKNFLEPIESMEIVPKVEEFSKSTKAFRSGIFDCFMKIMYSKEFFSFKRLKKIPIIKLLFNFLAHEIKLEFKIFSIKKNRD